MQNSTAVKILSKDIYLRDIDYKFTINFDLEKSMSFYKEVGTEPSDPMARRVRS